MSNLNFPRMHVSLYVSDIQKSVNFYSALFGQVPVKIRNGYAKYILDKPSLIISFVENPERVQQNFGHLGFQVETPELLENWRARAKNLSLITKEETNVACCYAVQDKFWANDPDGIQWEIYYFHEDAEFNDPHFQTNEAAACCMPSDESKEKVKLNLSTLVKVEVNNAELKDAKVCSPKNGCC